MAKTMILKSIFIAYVALISLVSISTCSPSTEPTVDGFTTNLIHRDSPRSPSYDHSLSSSQRLANALRRSLTRANRFKAHISTQSPKVGIINSNGEYLMEYSIGNPPVPQLGIADTGSDIIWTQCQPCLQCFKQNSSFFSPRTSSTHRRVPCNSTACNSLTETSCTRKRKNCMYSETYGDGSFSQGLLATETITLASGDGKSVPIPNIIFGCGFKNGGIFDGGESGIVGLGGGNVSLVRQLGSLAQGKFSYCLVSVSDKSQNSSKLSFGAKAVVSGKGVVSTPLIRKQPDTYYFLTLEGISVGNKRIDYYEPSTANPVDIRGGNVIIDSGTTLLLLPSNLYGKVEKELNSTIKLKQIDDPLKVLELCYYTGQDYIEYPPVTLHFKGADLKLKQDNVFVRTSNVSLCFAAQPVLYGIGIIGNLAQIDFLVGYDLEKRTVSFKPTQCSK